MSQHHPKAAATLAALLLAATLCLPAAQAGRTTAVSAAGPVMATYTLPLAA